ncbi:Protein N-terminal asparagine amidohydrolase [Merluccius polli]|uniref:Protein N-terminal asparagine amidohydrolase n=1 Tax=Merluccius polli TaxID=89951 RepID=A0AA47NBG3_MERPO|nr:Protein N-terminal asparagine amidohydrolase [Merluccius polli]
MPLLIKNREIDRPRTTGELFDIHPHLQESAKAFCSKPLVDVDIKCLLYVQQREFAATIPSDRAVSVIGSDDATTCHLVVVRHTGSGAVCLAHCDGSSTWSEVPLIVKAVTSLSNHSKEGRLELHLVGGFNDESKTSHKLSLSLLTTFHKLKEDIHLETCCITGVNVNTGEVFPASFPHKGPAEELRSARTFTGGQMVDIYDSSRGLVKIGPCKWSPNLDIAFWMSQNDDTILKYLSTSPMAEPPHFVQHMKSTIEFLLHHPSSDVLFPAGQPQYYRRTDQGDWGRCPPE